MKRNLFFVLLAIVFLSGCAPSGPFMLPEPFGDSAWIPSDNEPFPCEITKDGAGGVEGVDFVYVQSEGICRKFHKREDRRRYNNFGSTTGKDPLHCSVGEKLVPVYDSETCVELQSNYDKNLQKQQVSFGNVVTSSSTKGRQIYENRYGGLTEREWYKLSTYEKCQANPKRLSYVCGLPQYQ